LFKVYIIGIHNKRVCCSIDLAEKAFQKVTILFVAKATAAAVHESYNNDDDGHDLHHHVQRA